MGHADIATTMLYVHHVPEDAAADRLTAVFRQAERPDLPPVSGHVRDTIGEEESEAEDENSPPAGLSLWARKDSNLRPTDYESAALTS